MQRIDLCGQPFKGLRERGMYYVDKSLLIKELLDSNDRGVFLFTRPRRFGKTTNLSMLDAFFNIRYAGNPWFDDLEISRYPEYAGYKNRFPVIHLNLNDTKANTYESYINKLRIAVKDAYKPHRYLLEDDDLDTAVRTTSIPSPGVTYRRISYPPRSRPLGCDIPEQQKTDHPHR